MKNSVTRKFVSNLEAITEFVRQAREYYDLGYFPALKLNGKTVTLDFTKSDEEIAQTLAPN